MTEYFRINSSTNNIQFDQAASGGKYALTPGTVRGLSTVKNRDETLRIIGNLPLEIRSAVLANGRGKCSVIEFEFDIVGTSDADMEDAEHDLIETLEDAAFYWASIGGRGNRAQLQVKSSGAASSSYKSIYYGVLDEQRGREVLGPGLAEHSIYGARLTLYCEPYWHPASTTNLASASVIYNHDDTDSGHDNFVDIAAANIGGDVPCRLLMRVEFDQKANRDYVRDLIVGRRTRATISNFKHWIEAESFDSNSNWSSSALTRCSGGSRVTDSSAATSGNIKINIDSVFGNVDDFGGSFDVFAVLYTDDITNSQFRLGYDAGASGYNYNSWIRVPVVSSWQLVYLGQMYFDQFNRSGRDPDNVYLTVEYEKDASDRVDCDFVWLIPNDEPRMMLEAPKSPLSSRALAVGEEWVVSSVEDFDYVCKETPGTSEWNFRFNLHGEIMSLQPNVDNRLYFSCISLVTTTEEWECHSTTDLSMKVTLDYLPQYISPLE